MIGIHSRVVQAGGMVLLLTALAGGLRADTLPLGATVAVADLYGSSGQLCSQEGTNSASCSVSGSTSTAVVNNGSGGMASVSLGSNTTAGAAATAYFFGLEGPSNVNVPIVINGYATTKDNSGDFGASFATYYIFQGSSTGYSLFGRYFASPNVCQYLSSEPVPCVSDGNFSLSTTVTSDEVFYVLFEAAAGGTNASALIDPTITINPSFADASEFTLVANPGVFPAPTSPTSPSSVPEPGSMALVGLAAGLVFVGRKKFSAQRIQ